LGRRRRKKGLVIRTFNHTKSHDEGTRNETLFPNTGGRGRREPSRRKMGKSDLLLGVAWGVVSKVWQIGRGEGKGHAP